MIFFESLHISENASSLYSSVTFYHSWRLFSSNASPLSVGGKKHTLQRASSPLRITLSVRKLWENLKRLCESSTAPSTARVCWSRSRFVLHPPSGLNRFKGRSATHGGNWNPYNVWRIRGGKWRNGDPLPEAQSKPLRVQRRGERGCERCFKRKAGKCSLQRCACTFSRRIFITYYYPFFYILIFILLFIFLYFKENSMILDRTKYCARYCQWIYKVFCMLIARCILIQMICRAGNDSSRNNKSFSVG